MPQWVYIIQSESSGRYYCGQSSNVEKRVSQHNDPDYRLSRTTKKFKGSWKLIRSFICPDLAHATRLERKIKKRGIGRYIEDVRSVESRQRRD